MHILQGLYNARAKIQYSQKLKNMFFALKDYSGGIQVEFRWNSGIWSTLTLHYFLANHTLFYARRRAPAPARTLHCTLSTRTRKARAAQNKAMCFLTSMLYWLHLVSFSPLPPRPPIALHCPMHADSEYEVLVGNVRVQAVAALH